MSNACATFDPGFIPGSAACRRYNRVRLFEPLFMMAIVSLSTMISPSRAGPATFVGLLCGSAPLVHASTTGEDRPVTEITQVSSEEIANGKRMTTLYVRFPPRAFTPKHIHGGAVNAYIIKGTVRSQLAGQPVRDYRAGEAFVEPYNAVHLFAENPSPDQEAELLAVVVHDEGVPLTTFIK